MERSKGGRPKKTVNGVLTVSPYARAIKDAGITYQTAERWKLFAAEPIKALKAYVARAERISVEVKVKAGNQEHVFIMKKLSNKYLIRRPGCPKKRARKPQDRRNGKG